MVLCRFFQQGKCRYGSKCNNEHIDLRQLVKADVEASINGKQWPFSCYGPFKDRPSLPNFIDDQSFEEIRLMCYEAKQKNFFEQLSHQLNSAVLEVNNKMKALLQFTPDVLTMLINVYESPVSGKKGETIKPNNPFSANPIFNKTNDVHANTFGANANNDSNKSLTSFGGNLFTSNSANSNQANTGNFFGSSSIFSQNKEQQQQQSSIFGQTLQQTPSVFSNAANNIRQASFSMYNNQASNFNGGNIFGQIQPSQQQQQQPQSNPNGFGLFSQTAMSQQQTQNQSSVFGLPASSGTNYPNQSIFNQSSNIQQVQQFAPANQQHPAQQTHGSIQNAFSQQIQPNSTMFGMQQQMVGDQLQNGASNIFFATTLYSRMDTLSAEEIEAFRANDFHPCFLPSKPPPKEFIS